MNISESEQHKNERLSAFIDAEQSNTEISQIVDTLLNEQELKDTYIRMQLVNDSLHDQIDQSILNTDLLHRVSTALGELPAHCVDDALQLQPVRTENVTKTRKFQSLFQNLFQNRAVSGFSVAASVMLVTLTILQVFDSESNNPTETSLASNSPGVQEMTKQASPAFSATLDSASSEHPVTLVAAAAGTSDNERLKQQYQWIEADPALSRQVRQYINEHETHRAAYSLQPKIRAAAYQVSE